MPPFDGKRVSCILDQLFIGPSLPETVILNDGPEFSGTALDAWAGQHGVQLHFIQPRKPAQNALIESFNGKFRDECLNEHWFLTLQETQVVIRPATENLRRADVQCHWGYDAHGFHSQPS